MKIKISLLLVLVLSSVAYPYGSRNRYGDVTGTGATTSKVTISRIAGFQTDETWTVGAGAGVTLTPDTTPANVKYGTQSLKVYVPSGVDAIVQCTLPTPITVRGGIGFWVKTDNASAVTNVNVRCYEASGARHQLTNMVYEAGLPSIIMKLQDNIWNFVWLPKAGYPQGDAPWIKVGTPTNWGTTANPTYDITKIAFEIVVTGNTNVWFGDLLAQDASKAGIVLGFDDEYASVYTVAYPAMKERGWKGVLWVAGVNVGGVGFMTAAQIQELYNAGWDICSHSYAHTVSINSTPLAGIEADMITEIGFLKNNGWYRGFQFHGWPGNSGLSLPGDDGESIGDVAKEYFLGCRALSEFTLPANMDGVYTYWHDQQWSLWIPPNWHNLAYYGYSGTDFTTAMQGFVDLTISMRGVLNTHTHRILAGTPGTGNVSIDFFNAMIAYLDTEVAAGNIEVITMSDWYGLNQQEGRRARYE